MYRPPINAKTLKSVLQHWKSVPIARKDILVQIPQILMLYIWLKFFCQPESGHWERSGVIKLQIIRKHQEKPLYYKNRQNWWDIIIPDWKKMQLSDMSYMVTLSKCLFPTDETKYSKWIQNDIQMKETKKLFKQHNRVVKNVQNNQRKSRTRKVKEDDWLLSNKKTPPFNQTNDSNSTHSENRQIKTNQIYERSIAIYLSIIWMKERI